MKIKLYWWIFNKGVFEQLISIIYSAEERIFYTCDFRVLLTFKIDNFSNMQNFSLIKIRNYFE